MVIVQRSASKEPKENATMLFRLVGLVLVSLLVILAAVPALGNDIFLYPKEPELPLTQQRKAA